MANRVYGYQGINNQNGYQYETSPKKLQPEFEQDEQKIEKRSTKRVHESKVKAPEASKKKVEHVHKMSKEDFKKKASFVGYVAFGFVILFAISYRNSVINERFTEKENLKTELAEIQKVNEQLRVSVENELNLTGVEKSAKESLGMSKLNNDQKVYISLPKKEYVESQAEKSSFAEQSTDLYNTIIDTVTEFFNM